MIYAFGCCRHENKPAASVTYTLHDHLACNITNCDHTNYLRNTEYYCVANANNMTVYIYIYI